MNIMFGLRWLTEEEEESYCSTKQNKSGRNQKPILVYEDITMKEKASAKTEWDKNSTR